MSFEEWSASGYKIKKGSKSRLRDAMGLPQFTSDQVVRYEPRTRKNTETIWESSTRKARAKGTPFGVVEDFDSYVRERGMLPDLNSRVVYAISDPLERHFMKVADKHGIFDGMEDEMDEW